MAAVSGETVRARPVREFHYEGLGSLGPVALRVLASLAFVGAITFVCFFAIRVNSTTAGFAYLLAVLAVATWWGLVEATVASFAAVLCFNFFFIPPIMTFSVADPENWVALFAFLATSYVASQVSQHAKQRTEEALDRQQDMERLYALSRAILLTHTEEAVAHKIAQQIAQVWNFSSAALYDRNSGIVHYSGPEDMPGIEDRLREVALKGTLLRDEAADTAVTAIRLGGEPIGALALRGRLPSDTVLQALSNLAAIGLERAKVQENSYRAEASRQSQELKSTLLDAMAHEFKTPLTSMKAATSALLSGAVTEPAGRLEMVTVVDEEIDHLSRLVTEAIRVARIEAGDVQLNRARCKLGPLLLRVLHSLETAAEGRPISIDVAPDIPEIEADADLVELAMRQLVDNAVRYSPPDAPIIVEARRSADLVAIAVIDRGSGIPASERQRVFEKFFRGSSAAKARGTGMGLAIARQIARAHGGDVWLERTSTEGSEFRLSLPVSARETQA